MSLRLTLTEKPDGAFVLASDYLYAGPAYKAPCFFAVEPRRGDNVQTSYLTRDQARQLRDELTAFLGGPVEDAENNWRKTELIDDHDHARILMVEKAKLADENKNLRGANEALRRDNDDLTRQKDRLIAENEALRQWVASLEKDAADRRRAFETLFPINPFRWTK